MIQSGGFLGRILGPSLKTGLPLIKNVIKPLIKPLAKSVLIPLGLTATISAADAGINKKFLGPGRRYSSSSASHNTKTLIISNNEMEDIVKIVKSLEDSGLLLKGVTETVQNEVKEQKGGFLSILLGPLDTSLLGNSLAGTGINRAGKGRGREINRASEGISRIGYSNNKIDF